VVHTSAVAVDAFCGEPPKTANIPSTTVSRTR
jgi:hypothetical protein